MKNPTNLKSEELTLAGAIKVLLPTFFRHLHEFQSSQLV